MPLPILCGLIFRRANSRPRYPLRTAEREETYCRYRVWSRGDGRGRALSERDRDARYDLGNIRFDNQIEIEGAGSDAFSAGGDSGSVIVTADTREAIALLFAGGDIGGTNGKGLTYANPLRAVLDALKIDLA